MIPEGGMFTKPPLPGFVPSSASDYSASNEESEQNKKAKKSRWN